MLSSMLWGLRNLWTRRGQAMAQALLVAVGMGAAMGVARLEHASDKALVDELEGVDLILAAVGSPTQALLASVFHLDDPTGNVDSAWANQWMQHPAVAECGVVGAADLERGQVVMAFVVLKSGNSGSPALEKEIQEFVKQTIAPFKYPRRVVFCDALPRTETGKLQRFKLRQQAPAFNSEK